MRKGFLNDSKPKATRSARTMPPQPPAQPPAPAPVGANPIIDDYSYCHVCTTSTSRTCPGCKIAFFCSDRCAQISQGRGHAAACKYNRRATALCCAADNTSQFRSCDNRLGAIMLCTNTGKTRGGVATDVYYALLFSCEYRRVIPKQCSIGLVIVDTPPHEQSFAHDGTIVGRIGVLGEPEKPKPMHFSMRCAKLDEVDEDLSKKAAHRKARTARAIVLLKHLKLLAGEMMVHARISDAGPHADKRGDWGWLCPKHTYVICTPVLVAGYEPSVNGNVSPLKESWMLQVDTIECSPGSGRVTDKGVGGGETEGNVSYSNAPLEHYEGQGIYARTLSLLGVGEVAETNEPKSATWLDVEPPLLHNSPNGCVRVATNRVIEEALGITPRQGWPVDQSGR